MQRRRPYKSGGTQPEKQRKQLRSNSSINFEYWTLNGEFYASLPAFLTQLHILVIGHDEDDVGSDISAVPLYTTPESLSPGGGKTPAAWSPVQRQQDQPGEPVNQHGIQVNQVAG